MCVCEEGERENRQEGRRREKTGGGVGTKGKRARYSLLYSMLRMLFYLVFS